MKTFRVPFALLLLIGSFALAQTPVSEAGAAAGTSPPTAVTRTPQELEQLLAPIALYPDALIAIILPASTAPADIVLAARYLRESPNDRSQIENRAWDESVKSLTNYPDVLKWMDENLQWTKQIGEAFAAQSSDVMQAIQRLRAQARTAGTLTDTPQQQVIAEPDEIRIVPAQPDVIYVPYYEPDVVFVDRPVFYSQPFLTFGAGVPVGSWLAFECDWRRHTIWVGDRHRPWSRPDWRRPLVPLGPVYSGPHYTRTAPVRQWHPPVARPVFNVTPRTPPAVVRPGPFRTGPSHVYGPATRSSFADNRVTPTQQPSPAAPTSGRTFVPGGRRQASNLPTPSPSNQTTPTTATFAPTVIAPALAPTVSTPTVTPPPTQRRSGVEWPRDRGDNRARNYSYSRGAANAAPSSAPTPIVGPTPQPAVPSAPAYTYSRQPHVISQPNVATAAPPVHYRQAPAPVVMAPVQVAPAPAPAPQAAAPAAQPPPASSAPSHRGGGGGRRAQEN